MDASGLKEIGGFSNKNTEDLSFHPRDNIQDS